jgi:hypothetical protein
MVDATLAFLACEKEDAQSYALSLGLVSEKCPKKTVRGMELYAALSLSSFQE